MGLSRTHTDAQTDGDQVRIREKIRGEGKIRINGRDKSRKNVREKERGRNPYFRFIFLTVSFFHPPASAGRVGKKRVMKNKINVSW